MKKKIGWKKKDKQKYEESLNNISEPIMLSDIREKMDLRGLVKYAREKGVKVEQLSEEEKELYVKSLARQASKM